MRVFSRRKNGNISATDTTLSILPILGVSIICVKRNQMRYSGQPTLCSIAPTEGPLLPLYKYIEVLTLSQYTSKYSAVDSKVLGSRCYYLSMYCCCITETHAFVPKFCRPITYQDKHDRLSKTSTLHSSITAVPESIRLFHIASLFSEIN